MRRLERIFDAIFMILFIQIKSLVGTPEFVAPEVVNYDFISTGTGNVELILKQNSFFVQICNFQTFGHWESFVIFCSPDILLLWAITTQKPIIILASKYSWSHCYQPDIQFIISASILILILRNSTRYQKTLRISFPNF